MKFLTLIIKNLLRNKRRTLLTVSSIMVSLFLVATLRTLLTELQNPPETPDSALRLITRHRTSLFNVLPIAHKEKIAGIEGVEAVTGSMWFGGIYEDPSNFFANFAIDSKEFFQVHPDVMISEAEKLAYLEDRTGAIAGDNLADRFGWKLGEKIFLDSNLFNFDPELTLRGIYREGPDSGNSLYFHWDYFNEALGNPGFTGTFALRTSSPEAIPLAAEKIDALFLNSTAPTKTETEKAFLLSFVEMMGDVQFFITSIVSVVVFTIVLVAANTMAMSIRERVREIGILKALGFRSAQVLGLLLGESMLLALLGALIGSWGAKLIFGSINMSALTGGLMQRFSVTPGTLILCAFIGLFVGLISAGIPAWQASRRPVVEAMRRR
ncbi:MAG: ABC transporter permease [Acidobacteriota bacterium]